MFKTAAHIRLQDKGRYDNPVKLYNETRCGNRLLRSSTTQTGNGDLNGGT